MRSVQATEKAWLLPGFFSLAIRSWPALPNSKRVLHLVQVRPAQPPAAKAKDDDSVSDSDDDDEDLDLFGELTPEEQKAAEEKKRIIEAAKKRGAEKAKLTKSMVVLEVKPWDDTTGLLLPCLQS